MMVDTHEKKHYSYYDTQSIKQSNRSTTYNKRIAPEDKAATTKVVKTALIGRLSEKCWLTQPIVSFRRTL